MLIIDEKKIYQKIYDMKLPDDASDVILISKRMTGNNDIYHNCATGIQSTDLEEVQRKDKPSLFFFARGMMIDGYFTVYNKEFDVIVIIPVFFGLTTPTEGEIRHWHQNEYYQNFCFVFNKKGECYIPYACKMYPNSLFNAAIDVYATNTKHCSSHLNQNKSIKILNDYFGYVFNKSTLEYSCFACSYNIIDLINQTPSRELSGQHKVQDIIDIKLNDISESNLEKIFELTKRGHFHKDKDWQAYYAHHFDVNTVKNKIRRHAIIEKVNENISVIRIFLTILNPLEFDDENFTFCNIKQMIPCEIIRIYVLDSNIFVCKNYYGKWIVIQRGLNVELFQFLLIDAPDDAINNCKLQYLRENINKCLEETNKLEDINIHVPHFVFEWGSNALKASIELYSLLENNLYESLIKSEYKELGKELKSLTNNTSPRNAIKTLFGDINDRETSLTKAIGVPGFMLKELDIIISEARDQEKPYYTSAIADTIAVFKSIFGTNPSYLKNMNKEMFKEMVNKYISIFNRIGITNRYASMSSYQDEKDIVRFVVKMLIEMKGESNVLLYLDALNWIATTFATPHLHYYYDYIKMCFSLGINNVPYSFKSRRDFIDAHNRITDLYNLTHDKNREKEINEKFNKLISKWDELNYSEKEFSIIHPSKYVDIVEEGLSLHHCVKSYIEDVANEKTMILFIRKTDDIETPFFTLEVKNGAIRQCHGYANSNTDTVVGLIEFIKRYCNEKNIVYNDGNAALAAN